MSEPTTEAGGVRGRYSRWRARSRGRSTLKAAYAQAARDLQRMDPAVRERIGRANLNAADLRQLASFHVGAQFRPGQFGEISQRLGQAAADRVQRAGPAPRQPRISQTRNPVRRLVNRYSRWGRNERRGTKVLKAALQQAARDVKSTDPAVQLAIGRSTLTSADLAAMASGRMDEVFRPEGRFQGVPGQQAQAGAGRQQPPPQQSGQMAERIAGLQQSIAENQQRMITLMEENNRLQAEMRQLLETRVQQLQQEVSSLNQAIGTGQDLNRQQAPQLGDNGRLDNPAITPGQEPNQPRGENQPDSRGDQQPGDQRAGDQRAAGEPAERGEGGERGGVGEAEVGEGNAGGEKSGTGERPAAGETEIGEGNGPTSGDGSKPQATQDPAEEWTVSSETQGESARAREAAAATQERNGNGAEAMQPGEGEPAAVATPGAPEGGPQQQQPGAEGRGPDTGDQLLNAHRLTYDGAITPPGGSSPQQAGETVAATNGERGRPQRGAQNGPGRTSPTKDGR